MANLVRALCATVPARVMAQPVAANETVGA
jgi:hypothetical protein